MHEIICPHCAKAFKIDEAGYADILKQVRDTEFEQQLNARLELAAQEKTTAIELATTKLTSEMQKDAATKDAEIKQLKEKLRTGEVVQKLAVNEAVGPKDSEIQQLNSKLASMEIGQKLAITQALNAVEKERDELKSSLECAALEKELAEKLLKDKYETQITDR